MEQMTIIERKMQSLNDTLFHFENRLKTIEDYRVEIDIIRDAQRQLEKTTHERQLAMRKTIEKNFEKQIEEEDRLDKRITDIIKLCEELPAQMKKCENKCVTMEEICERLVKNAMDLGTQIRQVDNLKHSH